MEKEVKITNCWPSNLDQVWVNQAWKFQVCSSLFLSSSFETLHSKAIVWMRTLHIHVSNHSSATGHLPFMVWGGVQATSGELWPKNFPKNASHAWSSTFGASVQLFRAWHVQSGHTQSTEHMQLWVSRSSTIAFSSYLAVKSIPVQPKMLLCI